MSIKTFIPARNHTNATSVDMQRQLVVICQNIKKKNIRIFKNLITFSNNCIFQNFTLLNKKDISLLSKKLFYFGSTPTKKLHLVYFAQSPDLDQSGGTEERS